MNDLIDERNRKEKMKKSVVKFWNVNYIDLETLRRMEAEEQLRQAQTIVDRLESEKEADEAEKNAEIERAYEEAAMLNASDYNATTGSYSGSYGKGGVDEVNKDQIDKILQEKDSALLDLIQHEVEVENE